MSEGYIILNSESRNNKANTAAKDATYNLKHVGLDQTKRYEIALISSHWIADVLGAGTGVDSEAILSQFLIIHSNLVKNNDYKSLTDEANRNFSTTSILSVINPTSDAGNIGTAPKSIFLKDKIEITYQEMNLANMSDVKIKIFDKDDDVIRQPSVSVGGAETGQITDYLLVFKYREMK